jgi:predicted transcriptional regulator
MNINALVQDIKILQIQLKAKSDQLDRELKNLLNIDFSHIGPPVPTTSGTAGTTGTAPPRARPNKRQREEEVLALLSDGRRLHLAEIKSRLRRGHVETKRTLSNLVKRGQLAWERNGRATQYYATATTRRTAKIAKKSAKKATKRISAAYTKGRNKILDHFNEHGNWITIPALTKVVLVSRHTAYKAIKELVAEGALKSAVDAAGVTQYARAS